jgi:hypothetical protein
METLEPGGWFESHEYDAEFQCDDGTLNSNGPMMGWSQNMVNAGIAVGRSMCIAKYLKQIYLDVGFVDVTERVFKIPTNAWPKDEKLKELGRLWEWNYARGVSAFSYGLFNRAFGMTRDQIEVSSLLHPAPESRVFVCLLLFTDTSFSCTVGLAGRRTEGIGRYKSTRVRVPIRRLGKKAFPRRGCQRRTHFPEKVRSQGVSSFSSCELYNFGSSDRMGSD